MKTHFRLALMGLMAMLLSGCVEPAFDRGLAIEKSQPVEIENYNQEPSSTF